VNGEVGGSSPRGWQGEAHGINLRDFIAPDFPIFLLNIRSKTRVSERQVGRSECGLSAALGTRCAWTPSYANAYITELSRLPGRLLRIHRALMIG